MKTFLYVKRQVLAWEEIFENHIFVKGQVSIKNSQTTTVTKINNPIIKWTKVMNISLKRI